MPISDKLLTDEIAERFWSHVDIDSSEDNCWLWKNIPAERYPNFSIASIVSVSAGQVALTLNGEPQPHSKAIACHTCDVCSCVRPKHLYWSTAKTNLDDAHTRGRRAIGSKHHHAKLTEEKVLVIRKMLREKVPQKVIAQEMGVTPPAIFAVAHGLTWKSVPLENEKMGID